MSSQAKKPARQDWLCDSRRSAKIAEFLNLKIEEVIYAFAEVDFVVIIAII